MSFMERYINASPIQESETPDDVIEKGEYPSKIINARVSKQEGTGRDGKPYAFGDIRAQWQVVEGPKKNQTFWTPLTITAPDKSGDDAADKRRLYYTQHILDATGLGKRIDPNFAREERPHPTQAGKMVTVFKARLLSKQDLFQIACDSAEAEALSKMIVGVNGIVKVGQKPFTRSDGTEGLNNTIADVTPLNDATLRAWRDGGKSGVGTPSTVSASPYSR